MKTQPNDFQETIRKNMKTYENVKQLVVDCDKKMKKLDEAHKKELDSLKMSKISSDDALSCTTEENTKIKDKEGTLLFLF